MRSQALNAAGNPEAIANMTFRSRVIPLFQFAVFFDKDMEFDNTAKLEFTGPIHSNGNIFLDSGAGSDTSLTLRGQVTSAYEIYRRQKRDNVCQGVVRIAAQNTNLVDLPCNADVNTPYDKAYYRTRYGGTVEPNIGELDVPSISALQPTASAEYWQKADVRIVLKRLDGVNTNNGTSWEPQFVNSTGQRLNPVGCTQLGTAPITLPTNPALGSAVSYTQSFRDTREARYWDAQPAPGPTRSTKTLLEIDVKRLMDCIESPTNASILNISGGLQNSTEGGLVIYMTFDDRGGSTVATSLLSVPLTNGSNGAIAQANQPVANNYGVRLRNGDLIQATSGNKPKGVTFVTDQAVYVMGDFNSSSPTSSNWVPTAILADSFNVLSKNWLTTPANGRFLSATELAKNPSVSAYVSPDAYWKTSAGWQSAANGCANSLPSGATPLYYGTEQIGTRTYCLYRDADMNARFATTDRPNAVYTGNPKVTSAQLSAPPTSNFVGDEKSRLDLNARLADDTTINAAILAGTATTVAERQIYDNLASNLQSGGVHNMMRFHEEWGANGGHPNGIQPYNYRGSLVSLDKPLHAVGSFQVGQPTYNPPLRQWSFEENFRQVAKLPPSRPASCTSSRKTLPAISSSRRRIKKAEALCLRLVLHLSPAALPHHQNTQSGRCRFPPCPLRGRQRA
ncbi:hypothetical protein [Deinococcus multiflagellatus]|uniref:Uncharacterized protein n=1 Tax=Deinococcus multiflagellatus TaxID=1656887 RepID=A0ABW1ZMU9_9DEIO